MDVKNFKSRLKEFSKIQDRSEQLFFLNEAKKTFKTLPQKEQEQILKDEKEYREMLMKETELFLNEKDSYELPETLKSLIQL
jgi:hypothetical protein